jgi:hypothetical protein
VIDLPEFQAEMGHPPRDRTWVVRACYFPIQTGAAAVIAECQAAAAGRGTFGRWRIERCFEDARGR